MSMDGVNENDAEECDACDAVDDICAYHRGVAAGIQMLASAFFFLSTDPEVAMETAATVKKFRMELANKNLSKRLNG